MQNGRNIEQDKAGMALSQDISGRNLSPHEVRTYFLHTQKGCLHSYLKWIMKYDNEYELH